jgi:diacylglycerol O-acyltransferase
MASFLTARGVSAGSGTPADELEPAFGALMERLSGLDAAFLAMETGTMHMHVSAAMIFEPGSDRELEPASAHFERMRALVSTRIHLVPALRRSVLRVPFGLNHPVWIEDPDFNPEFHLRRSSVPAPGGPAELASFVADVVARPLDTTRPLWEMHLVEGLESGHLAVVPKFHHAIIDGVSGAELLGVFLDDSPGGGWTGHTPVRRQRDNVPTGTELIAWGITSLVRHPERALDAITGTLTTARKLAERNRRLKEEDDLEPPPAPFRAPKTSLNGAISPYRSFACLDAPLEDFRRVRDAFGGTLNDVLLAAVAGALRRLLAERGERLDDPLVAMIPVSARPRGSHSIGSERNDVGLFGNRISAMLVSLATSVADPVERLGVISEGTRLAKEQARVVTDEVIRRWAQLAFPALSSRIARLAGNLRVFDHMRPLFNVVVSNIPGPQSPLWFANSRLRAVYPVGPIVEGVGLNITAMSYMGTLYIGILGCRDLVPEVDHLGHLLEDSVAELAKAAGRTGGHWA